MAAVTDVGRAAAHDPKPAVMTHRQIMFVIYGLMAGMFLSALDQTIVGTAIRTIGDELHGLDQQAWVTTAYLIAATVTTPLYGKLSDLFGRRPLFILSISIFVLGSFLSSFSTSMLMLAAFRAVQGLGAGGLMSLPLAIMGDMLAPRERARYQGYFLATFGIASVIGPLVGGLFAGADQLFGVTGWRWVFLVNVPVGVVALLMVIAFLHLPHVPHARPRIDWWGAGLVVATLAPLLLVAEQGRDWGWLSWPSITCYAIGAAGLAGFILVERAMGASAIIPLSLFDNRTFSITTVLSILVGFGMFGAMLTLPLYLQIVLGMSPTDSGFASLPMMAGIMTASIGTGQIVARTGRYAIFPRTGTATTAAGFLLLAFMTPDRPYAYLAVAMFVIGLGLGQLMQTLVMAVQAAVDAGQIGVATSSATFFRQIGGTLGTAIMLSLLFAILPTNISTALADEKTTWHALDAALNPAIADDPANAAIMERLWTPITDKTTDQVDEELAEATTQVKDGVKAAVRAKVTRAVTAKAADGLDELSSGLDELADGTGAFVDGVGRLGSGARQLAGGLATVSRAEQVAARNARQATADFGAVQAALTSMSADQQSCADGDTASCTRLADDQSALATALKRLGTSVYTTSGYLNGAPGKPGLASGLAQLAAGADRLADGATIAADKGSAIPAGAAGAATGAGTLSKLPAMIDKAVKKALPDAYAKALRSVAFERNLSVRDGRLAIDWADPVQRWAMVDKLAPTMATAIRAGDTGDTALDGDAGTSDTSFLTGAHPALTRPFLVGFNNAVVAIYWVALGVMTVAFVITLFFRVPPLRTRSALQERSDNAALEGLA